MDLYGVETYLQPKSLQEVKAWQSDWNWLAGGTWIFNQAQPQVKTLVDMEKFDWTEIEITPEGLTIGATCIQNDLLDFSFPESWTATEALKDAVRELASFKLSHAATVGGNICLALSASTFAPVMVALDASYEIWRPNGEPYFVDAVDFQTAPQQTILQPGEVLRRIKIPAQNLQWQTSFKRMAVCTAGYAIAIVVTAYHTQTQQVRFGIAGSVRSPQLVTGELGSISLHEQMPPSVEYLEDERGSTAYRRHVTGVLMQRGITELTTGMKGDRRY
ncbi:xanthine dehydrogenase family protein subunit M [Myxosarcina sp. GI1]|uniref:FAD binding domain-containing protein n=1 Tax=Myxosarcina sp. GI1 TaxID=1541065 RepID=UPI0005644034|nr:FAD binding domain-containing protein [Myxosarcina sp. GI1]